MCVDTVFALSLRLTMAFGYEPRDSFDGPAIVPALVAVLLFFVVLHVAWRLLRQQHNELAQASNTARLMDTVLSVTRGCLWAVGATAASRFPARRAATCSATNRPSCLAVPAAWWSP